MCVSVIIAIRIVLFQAELLKYVT